MSGRTHHNPAPLSIKGSSCQSGKNLRVFPDSEGEPVPAAVNSFRCPNRGECFWELKRGPGWLEGPFQLMCCGQEPVRLQGWKSEQKQRNITSRAAFQTPSFSEEEGKEGGLDFQGETRWLL